MPRRGELVFLYGESVAKCSHHIDKVFADYSTLQYMSAGAVDLAIGAAEHRLEGRWFWCAYPGPRIRFHAAAGTKTWRHRYIAFRGPLVERWRKLGLFPIEPQPSPGDVDYGDRFDALLRHATVSEQWGALRATHLLEDILIDLAEARTQKRRHGAWLEQIIDRLRSAADDRAIDYQRIANEAGMSPRSLRRRFHEALGMSPHEYVLRSRIAEARRLLGETDLPTKVIAETLGYRDVYFFTRQFRKLAGVPPAAYRKSRQG